MTLLAPPKDQVITQVRSRRPSLILSSVGSPAPSSQNLAALNLAAQQQQVSGVDGQGSGSDDQQRMSTVDLSLDIPALECSEGLVFEEEGDENMNGRRREGGKARGLGGNIAWGRDDSLKVSASYCCCAVTQKCTELMGVVDNLHRSIQVLLVTLLWRSGPRNGIQCCSMMFVTL